jgi:uncharacterized RDD family membrane protein YckC
MDPERPPREQPEQRGELAERERTPANGTIDALLEVTGRAVAPVARAGWRGARGAARRLGVDRALGRAVDRGVEAIDSDAAGRTAERVLDSNAAKRIWEKVLESEEAQQLVERVAEAPEVRSAITAQGVGLLEDIRRGLRRAARQLDTAVERVARVPLRRRPRAARPIYAGAVTRLLALAIDAGVVYGSLLLISAAIALLVSVLSSGDQGADSVVIALGAAIWLLIACAYLAFFWSGAGRTPGMSFIGLRIVSLDTEGVHAGQAIRRAIWLPISALPLLLGFWGVLFDERRRGWPDRRAGTVVLYTDPELDRDLGGDA